MPRRRIKQRKRRPIHGVAREENDDDLWPLVPGGRIARGDCRRFRVVAATVHHRPISTCLSSPRREPARTILLLSRPHALPVPGRMPRGGFSGSLRSPKIDVVIDMGNPFLNRTVDGFLKIGAVGACKVAAEETFECLHRGDVSKHRIEHALKKMCREGAYWGTVAGVYVGMVYGVERVRGRNDWKNAMIGGALSGALISGASNNHRDKIIKDAITAGALATAVEFINCLT